MVKKGDVRYVLKGWRDKIIMDDKQPAVIANTVDIDNNESFLDDYDNDSIED